VLLAFGRLIFFTDFEMIASVVGDYGGGTVNMAPFTDGGLFTPDMAFRRRLDISNPILWAKFDRDVILIGTADGVYAIRKINTGQIFSSDNIECVKQSHGGLVDVPPDPDRHLDDDRPARRPQAARGRIQPRQRPLRRAEHQRLAAPYPQGRRGPARVPGEPDELLWAVRGDGQLALHPHVPEQEVKGFARITHGDGPVSACAIPGDDGQDELWALVNGIAGRSVQLQDPAWEEGEPRSPTRSSSTAARPIRRADDDGQRAHPPCRATRSRCSPTARWSPGERRRRRHLTPALPRPRRRIHIGLPYRRG
jgi:hypothetical protein